MTATRTLIFAGIAAAFLPGMSLAQDWMQDSKNQKLSERRAQAVKDYLVSRDIAANRINADGKGETQPVTRAGACSGAKSAKVIACLQPDRRVHAEVTGTKSMTSSR